MIIYGDACCVTHFLVGNLLASKRKRVSENIQKSRNNSMATQRYTPSKVLNKTERVKKKRRVGLGVNMLSIHSELILCTQLLSFATAASTHLERTRRFTFIQIPNSKNLSTIES